MGSQQPANIKISPTLEFNPVSHLISLSDIRQWLGHNMDSNLLVTRKNLWFPKDSLLEAAPVAGQPRLLYYHKQVACNCQLDCIQLQTDGRLTPSYCCLITILNHRTHFEYGN